MTTAIRPAPVAHVDDAAGMAALLATLQTIHGSPYAFALRRWSGQTTIDAPDGRITYLFVVAAQRASAVLEPGDLVRGPAPGGPYRALDGEYAEVASRHAEAVWPGDVLTSGGDVSGVSAGATGRVALDGSGVALEVTAEQTAYRAPRLTLLRSLPDRPRGCAAYPGAFRREALPPDRTSVGALDHRGANRVNEHTLDMRTDRTPGPTAHYHGPVPCAGGRAVSHTETAIVLPRSVYGLPAMDSSPPDGGALDPAPLDGMPPDAAQERQTGGRPHVRARIESGHAILYMRPVEDPADTQRVPLRPGCIVVTPAVEGWLLGHRFENAFAMLVAIPGFVAPSTLIASPLDPR